MVEGSVAVDLLRRIASWSMKIEKYKHKMMELRKLIVLTNEFEGAVEGADGEVREWINKVKDVVYEIEDLVLELVSMKLIKEKDEKEGGGSISSLLKKIGLGLGLLKPRDVEIQIQIKSLAHQIDDLLLHHNFKSVNKCYLSPPPIPTLTHPDSFVLGREYDKDAIIRQLLTDIDSHSNVSVVGIVGMGGIGKTALARLIYNDTFFPFKAFATVGLHFCKSSILRQLLLLSSDLGYDELLPLFRHTFQGKKYLIVLDDVWSETPSDWLDLFTSVFTVGARGSRVLVTTRSKLVPQAIQPLIPVYSYDLPLLSDPDSWLLFHTLAFQHMPCSSTHNSNCDITVVDKSVHLTEIGKQILEKCGNLPLAIKLVASLLNGQPKTKWPEFAAHTSLFNITECGDQLMYTLKRSYSHLPPSLKTCFTYCSLFPTGYIINKDNLIAMWIAEGLVETTDSHPSFEDTAETYIMLLLNRSFFQIVKQDDSGEVLSIKMHDLMHDLALQLALVENGSSQQQQQQQQHNQSVDALLPKNTGFSTLLNFGYYSQPPLTHSTLVDRLSHSGFKSLRVLELSFLGITDLPTSVGGLVHLRYLSLNSNPDMDRLPTSIGKLQNLQTFILRECWSLKQLPSGLTNLINLRHLDVFGCNSLTHMPSGMHKLTSLHKLPMFVVGDGEGSWDSASNQLEDLKALSNLIGNLTIRILKGYPHHHHKSKVSTKAGYLYTKRHLTNLLIQWVNSKAINQDEDPRDQDVVLLDDLEPPTNCAGLELKGYPAMTFPSWGMQNLVILRIENCSRLQHLPPMHQIPCLKQLILHCLEDFEYVDDNSKLNIDIMGTISTPFFPSLEKLTLSSLPKLKGWWKMREVMRKEKVETLDPLPSLSRLSVLRIRECPCLLSFPFCPNVQELDLRRCGIALPSALFTSSHLHLRTLFVKKLMVDGVMYLNSLPTQAYQQLSSMIICLSDVESLSTSGNDVFCSPLPSLEFLEVSLCSKLRSLSGLGWMHLSALQRLTLSNLPVLDLDLTVDNAVADKEAMPWKYLTKLHSLELHCLPKLVSLPLGMQHLNSLQTLKIRGCFFLKQLPESMGALVHLRSLCIEACTGLVYLPQSMRCLTSLDDLKILYCSGRLRERCEKPFGVDWPKIQHIPHIYIN